MQERKSTIRYERVKDVLDLAIRLQAARGGMTIDEIQEELSVSRRTAERMRNTVEWAFAGLETVPAGDNKLHWRLESNALRRLVPITADNLSSLAKAISSLRQTGLDNLANSLADVETKLRAMQRRESLENIDSDLETLVQAEGLAMRPGPRQPIDPALLSLLREAILSGRTVEFSYAGRHSGKRSVQKVEPYGLLYGNRPFLVGKHTGFTDSRLWRIGNMSEVCLTGNLFERDPDFDLESFARRSFGTFQEEPMQVELLFSEVAAADAASFRFHPNQSIERHEDGTVTVCFKAGSLNEMCWHLVTWGDSVQVVKPEKLRQQMTQMCENLANHHRDD